MGTHARQSYANALKPAAAAPPAAAPPAAAPLAAAPLAAAPGVNFAVPSFMNHFAAAPGVPASVFRAPTGTPMISHLAALSALEHMAASGLLAPLATCSSPLAAGSAPLAAGSAPLAAGSAPLAAGSAPLAAESSTPPLPLISYEVEHDMRRLKKRTLNALKQLVCTKERSAPNKVSPARLVAGHIIPTASQVSPTRLVHNLPPDYNNVIMKKVEFGKWKMRIPTGFTVIGLDENIDISKTINAEHIMKKRRTQTYEELVGKVADGFLNSPPMPERQTTSLSTTGSFATPPSPLPPQK